MGCLELNLAQARDFQGTLQWGHGRGAAVAKVGVGWGPWGTPCRGNPGRMVGAQADADVELLWGDG